MKRTRLLAAAACCGVLVLPWIASSGCTVTTKVCTLVGCEDQAAVELRSATGAWTAGAYELALDLDGARATCTLQVPDSPSTTSVVDGTCNAPALVSLEFDADVQCGPGPTTGSGPNGTASETCTPVPGHFHATLTVFGTPHVMALSLTRAGHALLDTTVSPAYQVSQPNGPACDPTCHQASAQVTIGSDPGDAGAEASVGADAAKD